MALNLKLIKESDLFNLTVGLLCNSEEDTADYEVDHVILNRSSNNDAIYGTVTINRPSSVMGMKTVVKFTITRDYITITDGNGQPIRMSIYGLNNLKQYEGYDKP